LAAHAETSNAASASKAQTPGPRILLRVPARLFLFSAINLIFLLYPKKSFARRFAVSH
jgi:hypothetical protein